MPRMRWSEIAPHLTVDLDGRLFEHRTITQLEVDSLQHGRELHLVVAQKIADADAALTTREQLSGWLQFAHARQGSE